MKIEEMRKIRKERGYTYAMLSEMSGVPVPTIQKIFHGETQSPRYDTLRALEEALKGPEMSQRTVLRDRSSVYRPKLPGTGDERYPRQGSYTVEDYYALPDDQRVELIDGVFYDMSAPTRAHQLIAGEIYRQIANYIMDRNGPCTVYIAPLDVQLDCDDRTMVQPDVLIVCDKEKENRRNVFGAPDFVLEVISPSTKMKDSFLKLNKYLEAGVREYWIIDPYREKVLIYFFEGDDWPLICGFDEPIPVRIYNGELKIDPKHIKRWTEEMNTEE